MRMQAVDNTTILNTPVHYQRYLWQRLFGKEQDHGEKH